MVWSCASGWEDVLHCTNMNTDFIDFGNNILLQSVNLPKPVHYDQTDKINASIHIYIP